MHFAAPPNEQLAIFNLPPSSPESAILKPSPLFPIKFAFGTFASSKMTTLVGYTFQPIYSMINIRCMNK